MQLAGAELSVRLEHAMLARRASSPDIYWRIDPSADRLPRNSALADPVELMVCVLTIPRYEAPQPYTIETRGFMYRVVSDKLSEPW